MTGPAASRHAYRLTIGALTAAICVLAGFLLMVALPDISGLTATQAPTPTPVATPAPTMESGMALSPIAIEMPKDANCEGCHITTAGTVGTKPIPRLGHPVWGFRDCTLCHAQDALVDTAPGHSSLHTQDCLVCHQVNPDLASGTSGAPMRPEHMGGDTPCLSCHGVDEHAPLPDAMADRENCWVCHNGAEFSYLFESSPPETTPETTPDGASTGPRWVLVAP